MRTVVLLLLLLLVVAVSCSPGVVLLLLLGLVVLREKVWGTNSCNILRRVFGLPIVIGYWILDRE